MEPEAGGGESALSLAAAALRERRPAAVDQASAYQRKNAEATSMLLASLQRALAANRSFQSTVYAEIARINQRKAENRARTAALRRQLLRQRRSRNSRSTNRQADPAAASREASMTSPFFSDSNGEDVPEPNLDALKRSQLEESTLLASRNPPWSSQESKALQQIVLYHQHQNKKNKDQPINYEHVALQLASPASAGKRTGSQKQQPLQSSAHVHVPRTARECELHHRGSLPGRTAPSSWTKAESRKLAELAYGHESSWSDVVASFNEHFDKKQRTRWECFVHYQTKLNAPKLHWTLPQDQLLLRFVAAMGPQCVWNSPNCDAVTHLSTSLLQDKTRHQIVQRIHLSLCNPKLSSDPWTADEERKLVICLKIYHDAFARTGSTDGDGPQASSAAVSKALNVIAVHHFPHRSNKAVCDKWKKSLDPGHSSLPFTDQEDARLVEIASSSPHLGWADLCRQHFPNRHPERVAKRWAEVATNQQILDRERVVPVNGDGTSAAAVRLPKKGRRRQRGQTATSSDAEDREEVEPDDVFATEDFCLRIKRSRHS